MEKKRKSRSLWPRSVAWLITLVLIGGLLAGCESLRRALEQETVRTDDYRGAVGNALIDRSIEAPDVRYEQLMANIDDAEVVLERACQQVHKATRRPFIDKDMNAISLWGKLRAYQERERCECTTRDVLNSPELVSATSYSEITEQYPDMCSRLEPSLKRPP